MVNAWKCDPVIRSIVTDPKLGRTIATLAGWSGARLVGDSTWWKSPGASEVPFHQDVWLVESFLTPPDFLTCWIALDDCSDAVGTLEYIVASHRWPEGSCARTDTVGLDRLDLSAIAKTFGVDAPDLVSVQGRRGLCAFHHGRTWHGSSANVSRSKFRRAFAIHFIQSRSRFYRRPPNPLYAYYYALTKDSALDGREFPVTWSRTGYATQVAESGARLCPGFFDRFA